jgi:probable phosphoglycerate mutase
MSLIYLIRHGDTDAVGRTIVSWLPGVPINERGRAQAARLAERLAGVPFAAIYSSPLERARMTAEPLATKTGLEIRDCPDIGEFRFGDWTGRTLADLERDPAWEQFNRFGSRVRAPNGELMLEVQARVVTALEGMGERHPGGTVAAFSHADAIRAAVLHYLGMPVDLIERLEIHPASVTVLRLEDWGVQLLRLNDTGAP